MPGSVRTPELSRKNTTALRREPASADLRTEALARPEHPPQAHAAQLRYSNCVKTSSIPSIRVEPDFRAEVEAVLGEGETLSEFVEASVRASVERRRLQAEFVARGLLARDEARRTGVYVDADVVVDGLQRKLDAARAKLAKSRR